MSVKYEPITEALFNVLLDKEVAADQELYSLCLQAKQDLDKKEPENLVYTKLSKNLSWYLMVHEYKMPKSATAVAQAIQKVEQTYRGQAATALMLGNAFSAGLPH